MNKRSSVSSRVSGTTRVDLAISKSCKLFALLCFALLRAAPIPYMFRYPFGTCPIATKVAAYLKVTIIGGY